MCGNMDLSGNQTNCIDNAKERRLSNPEYVRYLEFYSLEDSEDNWKTFVIWKGFGMSI